MRAHSLLTATLPSPVISVSLDSLRKWIHTGFPLLCLAHYTEHIQVLPCVHKGLYFPSFKAPYQSAVCVLHILCFSSIHDSIVWLFQKCSNSQGQATLCRNDLTSLDKPGGVFHLLNCHCVLQVIRSKSYAHPRCPGISLLHISDNISLSSFW